MLKRGDTVLLRDYVSTNSGMLLNICFDRPLHIIRSEKTSAPEGKVAVYGIYEWSSPSTQRKLEVARQEIEMKKKSLALKSQEEARMQKAKSDDSNPEYRSTMQTAREAVERAKKELDEAKNAYAVSVSQLSQSNVPDEGYMTITSLELQHQGFKIVEILTSLNPEYLRNQNDVVRALRWLWRSRGRHYRLLHEEEIPPRYHYESSALGKFLVSYSQANPSDTDVLFDLIRIFVSLWHFATLDDDGGYVMNMCLSYLMPWVSYFPSPAHFSKLQPLSSFDFSFIKQYLHRTVSSNHCADQELRWTLILQR